MRHPALFYILFSSIFSPAHADEIQKFSLMDQGRLLASSRLAAVELPKECPIELLGHCYSPVTSFQPVELRKAGKWSVGWVENLLKARETELRAYPDFELRSMAYDGKSQLVVEEVFRYGSNTQTNIVFANLSVPSAGRMLVNVIGYGDVDPKAEEKRVDTRSVEIRFNGDLGIRPPKAQVETIDRRRAAIVGQVVQYLFDSGALSGFQVSANVHR